jgi:hypothetical protein
MRTFELSTHVQAISRSDGTSARQGWARRRSGAIPTPKASRSATAAAAYRACCIIECEREAKTHDYTSKAGLEASEIVLPNNAPEWARDRARLWNAAELRERNGKRGANANSFKANAQTARDLMFSFPSELSAAGRLNAARIVARHLVDTHGVAADFNIHEPGREGDERNHHCHLLMTTRRMTPDGLGKKSREWDERTAKGPAPAKRLREFIARTLNDELKAEGRADAVFVEHRSFRARGSGQVPTRHQGPTRTNILRKQKGRARQAWAAEQRKAQTERHARELASLTVRQDFALQGKLGQLSQRVRDGAAVIRRELQEQRRADIAPKGLPRLFQVVTGRAMRADFGRQTRATQRLDAAKEKLQDLKAELRAERTAFSKAQTNDREALTERHRREDQQLRQTVVSRAVADRSAERTARQPETRTMTNEQEQQRGQDRGRGPSP